MVEGIIAKKLGMTQIFGEKSEIETVTAVEAGPCPIIQVKTAAKDGYSAVKLAFGKAKRLNSPQKGQLKELGQLKYLREFRVAEGEAVKVGDKIDVNLFKVGDLVDVTGVSKGKGFAGVVKRHHFHGGPKTHGQSDRWRHAGAIGSTTTPGRVLKGLRMAGHMGDQQVTVRHLSILKIDLEHNLLLIKGAVPGGKNGILLVRKSDRIK
jgi:large subunit ribosomal protein L3